MRIGIFIIINFSFFLSFSQNGNYQIGARSASMGGASLTLCDAYSLFNNIGALASQENGVQIFSSYQNRYNVLEFQVTGGGIVYSNDIGTAGLGYYKFGDDLYSEQRINLAIGNKIQNISLGLGLNINQYHIESIGTKIVVLVEFGGLVQINPDISFGAHIYNVSQSRLDSELDYPLPTVMKAGISYKPSNELILTAEIEKDLDFDEVLKCGIEYMIIKNLYLRTGINTIANFGSFGFGIHPKRLKIDYSFINSFNIGNIHEFSLSYTIGK